MLHEKIMELTTEKGMSIRELERRAGLSNGTVGRWGSDTKVQAKTLRKVAKVLGVSMEYLLKE